MGISATPELPTATTRIHFHICGSWIYPRSEADRCGATPCDALAPMADILVEDRRQGKQTVILLTSLVCMVIESCSNSSAMEMRFASRTKNPWRSVA
jgi:hypothetical protein